MIDKMIQKMVDEIKIIDKLLPTLFDIQKIDEYTRRRGLIIYFLLTIYTLDEINDLTRE